MAPTQRKRWRKNIQQRDEGDDVYANGSGQHDLLQDNHGGAQSQYNNIRGSTSVEDDDGQAQEEPRLDGRGNLGQPTKKKARGPTYMKHIWAIRNKHDRLKVEINELGQVIGETSNQFAEFLGTVAKNGHYYPIDIKRWNQMPDVKKNEMIDVVKEKFVVPPGMEDNILQSLAKKWRNWKSTLKAKYYDANEPIDVQVQVGDERVNKDQWVQLMTHWKSKNAQVLSMRNKEVRKKKLMHHRTGKKSFARVAVQMKSTSGNSPSRVTMFKKCFTDKSGNPKSDVVAAKIVDMDERIKKLTPGSSDKISRNDVFAQVIGKDRNGRVRMIGGGIAPADLWEKVPSQKTSYRHAMEQKTAFEEMKNKYSDVLEQLKVQSAKFAEFEASVNHQRANGSTYNSGNVSASTSSSNATQTLPIGSMVALKSMFDPSKIVATGYLQSLDPTEMVGRNILGENWCSVLVQVAVEGLEMLIRPYDMFERIRDVLGCPIAWPIPLVVPEGSFR